MSITVPHSEMLSQSLCGLASALVPHKRDEGLAHTNLAIEIEAHVSRLFNGSDHNSACACWRDVGCIFMTLGAA